MKHEIAKTFLDAGQGFSPDRVVVDPDFGPIVEKTTPSRFSGMSPRTVIVVVLLIAVLAFVGLNLVIALLFAIKPFTECDRLDRPVPVKVVTETEILLADGRHVAPRLIRRLPKDHPVFRDVLKQGVEVDDRGEAYGLITLYPSCGSTAYRYVMRRINLGDLAGALSPDSLDRSAIPADEIEFLKETVLPTSNSHRVKDHFLGSIQRVRQVRERNR